MARRSALELFEQYYQALIFSLPMKDICFLEDLFEHDLLPEDIKHKLEVYSECNNKTLHFLDYVIKAELAVGDDRCFGNLLTVMNNSKYDHVKDLAKQIKSEYDVNAKCKLMIDMHIILYIYIHTHCICM